MMEIISLILIIFTRNFITENFCDGVPDRADGSDEKEHGELKTVEHSNYWIMYIFKYQVLKPS
jgi:hypothetical protein